MTNREKKKRTLQAVVLIGMFICFCFPPLGILIMFLALLCAESDPDWS